MENNSYLPTYTEAVQLDPSKLGKNRTRNDLIFMGFGYFGFLQLANKITVHSFSKL